MKRVLITGGAGSIGYHILNEFFRLTDWEIVMIDSFRHRGYHERVDFLLKEHPEYEPRLTVIQHDLVCPISEAMKRKIGDINYILHLAAISDVFFGQENPVFTVRNNVESTIVMYEYAKTIPHEAFVYFSTDEVYGPVKKDETHKEWDTHRPSNFYSASKAMGEDLGYAYWRNGDIKLIITNCFDMSTKIVTENGFKGYEEVKIGDLVLSLTDKGEIVKTPIRDIVRMRGPETMIQFQGEKIDQLVTPNHRMMVHDVIGSPRHLGPLTEIWAEKLVGMKGRKMVPLAGSWHGNLMPEKYSVGLASSKEMAAIYGWYVSEGFETTGNTVCFGAGTAWQKEELMLLLNKIGNPYINGRSVRVASRELKEIVPEFGTNAVNKHLPLWIKDLNKDDLQLFFDAAINGDGSRYPMALVYYTKSPQLAQDMCEVGMKLGYGVRISKRKTWNPTKTIQGESFIVRFRTSSAYIDSSFIKEIPYEGDVWCIKTDLGRVFVERNGKVSLSGQTMNNFGQWQSDTKFPVKIQRCLERGEKVLIHGNEKELGSRFYIHSKRVAHALLDILSKPVYTHQLGELDEPDRYHIVSSKCVNNLELAQKIAELMGRKLKYELQDFHKDNPAHDIHYGLSNSKLVINDNFDEDMKEVILFQADH
jgi:dTDP-D-glucose 4,6-dehydratase